LVVVVMYGGNDDDDTSLLQFSIKSTTNQPSLLMHILKTKCISS